jgi:hypothetical protein
MFACSYPMRFLFMDGLNVCMCEMDIHVEERVEREYLETYFKDYVH